VTQKGISDAIFGAVLHLPTIRRALRHALPSWPLVAAFSLIIGLTFYFDAPLLKSVRVAVTKPQKALAGIVSDFGDWPWLAAGSVLLLCTALYLRRVRTARMLLWMLAACTLAGVLSNIPRSLTGRTRPHAKDVPQGWYGIRYEGKWIVGKTRFNSFPSSHTAVLAGFVAPWFFFPRRRAPLALLFGTAAGAMIVLMGWSRVCLNRHHPSDVVVGAVIGIAVAWALRRWRPHVPALCNAVRACVVKPLLSKPS
jgi:undecaprenyl-diphosphatase